jgi:hypothetical protein
MLGGPVVWRSYLIPMRIDVGRQRPAADFALRQAASSAPQRPYATILRRLQTAVKGTTTIGGSPQMVIAAGYDG